jgi:hypothetical protein
MGYGVEGAELYVADAYLTAGGPVRRLEVGSARDLAQQARLTELLATAGPVLRPMPTDADCLAELSRLGPPIAMTAYGPDRAQRRSGGLWSRSAPCPDHAGAAGARGARTSLVGAGQAG